MSERVFERANHQHGLVRNGDGLHRLLSVRDQACRLPAARAHADVDGARVARGRRVLPVLLALGGLLLSRARFSTAAVERAAALAADRPGPVVVVIIAKVHGTSFGLPNPGLMPTRAELQERRAWVEWAIERLQQQGIKADGQVATPRRGVKLLAKVARLRGVSAVVTDGTAETGLRRMVEGDTGEDLRRRFRRHGDDIAVEIIPP